jgi:hypothetical protein
VQVSGSPVAATEVTPAQAAGPRRPQVREPATANRSPVPRRGLPGLRGGCRAGGAAAVSRVGRQSSLRARASTLAVAVERDCISKARERIEIVSWPSKT